MTDEESQAVGMAVAELTARIRSAKATAATGGMGTRYRVGDRIAVRPGAEHEPDNKGASGVIAEISTS